jgi:hypothetical protein
LVKLRSEYRIANSTAPRNVGVLITANPSIPSVVKW